MGEFGRGELCGIVETLIGSRRSITLLAVRDTEIVKIPGGIINSIKLRFPRVVSKLITLLGKRLLCIQQPGPAVLQMQGGTAGLQHSGRDSRDPGGASAVRGGRLHQGHQGASALPRGKHKVGALHLRSMNVYKSDFNVRIPTTTARWLEVTPWISRHYHIKIPDRMFTRPSHR